MTDENTPGRLFIFGGLPGVGKSELSRFLSERLGAVYLRIDTIEQSLRDAGQSVIGPEGYFVAYNLAGDNLRLGLDVVADSVNPLHLTREAWRDVARKAQAPFHEIEVVCSDRDEHRRRVTERKQLAQRPALPSWQDVVVREYHIWEGERIVVDTAGEQPVQSKKRLIQALAQAGVHIP